MLIKVQVFAWLKEIVGGPFVTVELATPLPTVRDLLAALALLRGAPSDFEARLTSCKVAVNEEYADQSHILNPTDEVALIPPVSGG